MRSSVFSFVRLIDADQSSNVNNDLAQSMISGVNLKAPKFGSNLSQSESFELEKSHWVYLMKRCSCLSENLMSMKFRQSLMTSQSLGLSLYYSNSLRIKSISDSRASESQEESDSLIQKMDSFDVSRCLISSFCSSRAKSTSLLISIWKSKNSLKTRLHVNTKFGSHSPVKLEIRSRHLPSKEQKLRDFFAAFSDH